MEKATRYLERFQKMYNNSSLQRAMWRDINEYLFPYSSCFLTNTQEDNSKGKKKGQKILNSEAGYARMVYANGMTGGTTSSTNPWFRFTLPDKDLLEYAPVKEWLYTVQTRMMSVFQRSNFYDSIANMHEELGCYGFNPMIIDSDPKYVIRCRPMTIGEGYIALDDQFRPGTLYRKFWMTVEQLVHEFGHKTPDGKVRAKNGAGEGVPEGIWKSYQEGKLDERYTVTHVIEKRNTWAKGDLGPKAMPWADIYILDSKLRQDGESEFLRVGGHKTKPFIAPRFKATGSQIYGSSCPGIESLYDVQQLQRMEKDKLMGIARQVSPPMNAPASLEMKGGGSTLPNAVNYIDIAQGQQGFTPTLQVQPDLNGLLLTMDKVEQRIRRHFGVDLFLMLANEDKNMTATEVARRHTEKLHQLGPALTRFNHEGLNPVIDRTFSLMDDFGMVPPPPEEMQGMEMSVEYISILADAQRMAAVPAIEQFASFAGGILAANPESTDKIDWDEMIDEAADRFTVPPNLVRSDEDVANIRAQRAQQQQAQQAVESGLAMAEGAKTLSETTVGDESMLDRTLRGIA